MRSRQGDTGGGQRIVAGRVTADGTVASGVDFTIAKPATGAYIVRFAPRFRCIPAVVATTRGAPVAQTEISVDQESAESVRVVTDGGSTDNAFSFVAVGPA